MNNFQSKAVSIVFLMVFVFTSAFAENEAKTKDFLGMSPKEYLVNKKHGGYVMKEASGHGRILIVNQQTKVATSELKRLCRAYQDEQSLRIDFSDTPEPAEIKIEIVDKQGERSLSIFPDQLCAEVNVAPLSVDNPQHDIVCSRARKQVLRAMLYLTGITGGYEGSLLDVMKDLGRLDNAKEIVPGDLSVRSKRFLVRCGVKPYVRTTYHKACEEGWAPAPTNDIQRTIWNTVHAAPKNPMKIEFDPKKGR